MSNKNQDKKAKEIAEGLQKVFSYYEELAHEYNRCIENQYVEEVTQIEEELAFCGENFFVAMKSYARDKISKEAFYQECMKSLTQYMNQKGMQDLFNRSTNEENNSEEDESGR